MWLEPEQKGPWSALMHPSLPLDAKSLVCGQCHHTHTHNLWILYGGHPKKLERYREYQHGRCVRMTRTNRR